ncbi:hypothetical protein LTR85_007026 [Meristemomyces frigidus]|nr:hypothetical protein LTR85_007026 [Meristemomyces frigidus]
MTKPFNPKESAVSVVGDTNTQHRRIRKHSVDSAPVIMIDDDTDEKPTTPPPASPVTAAAGTFEERFHAGLDFLQDKYYANEEIVDALDTLAILIEGSLLLGLSVAATLHFGAKAVNLFGAFRTSPANRLIAGREPTKVSVTMMTTVAAFFMVANVVKTVQAYVEGEETFKDKVLDGLKSVVRMQMGLLLVLGVFAVLDDALGMAV